MIDYSFHVFENEGNKFLYLSEFKQLFNILDDEYFILKNKKDDNILKKYFNNVYEIDKRDKKTLKQNHYGLFLCIANLCNAKCIYCFANQGDYGKTQGVMPDEICFSAIDYYMNIVPDDCVASIIFFGGEPLIAYNKIVETCKYVKDNYYGKKNYSFHLVTNAVLLNEDIIDFLANNNFGVAISIDGGSKLQNIQRPLVNGKDSFVEATKNLDYLFSKIKNVHARGTYCNFDLNLSNIYKDLIELGFKEVDVPPDILDIKNTYEMDKLLEQMDILYKYILEYIEMNDDFPFGLFINHIRRIFMPKLDASYGCGLGQTTFSVDIQGDIYPCHRYSSIEKSKLGNVLAANKANKSKLEVISPVCEKCWNQYTCSHGCHYNDEHITGKINRKNEYWCRYSQKMTELALALCSKLSNEQLIKIMGL